MTSVPRPKFIDSPYFVSEPGNWHLKPGAPQEVVEAFEKFQRNMKLSEGLFTISPPPKKPDVD